MERAARGPVAGGQTCEHGRQLRGGLLLCFLFFNILNIFYFFILSLKIKLCYGVGS